MHDFLPRPHPMDDTIIQSFGIPYMVTIHNRCTGMGYAIARQRAEQL